MDIKLIHQFKDCIHKLLKSPANSNNSTKFCDAMLYVVNDVSCYGDLTIINNIHPISSPFIVVSLGKKDTSPDKPRSRSLDRNQSDVMSQKSCISEDTNSSYEGSPLEMKEYADFNKVILSPTRYSYVKNHSSFVPVDVSNSNCLLSVYCSLMLSPKYSIDDDERVPILVYCNGEDLLKTAFIYVSPEVTDLNNTVLIYSTITVSDTTYDISSIPAVSDSFPENMCQVSSFAEYCVLDSSSNNDQSDESSNITLEAEWNHSMKFLDKPSPEARVTVKVTIVSSDKMGPAYKNSQEIIALREFCKGLLKGEVGWLMQQSERPAVIDELKELFQQLKLGNTDIKENFIENESDEEIPHKICMINRKDLDFSDKMWNVLMNCHCHEELVDCLKFMFEELECQQIQPLVHKSNKTRIADLVRSSYTNSLDIPDMEGYTPLKLLIDIGIEKLTSDYISLLISNELVSLDQIHFYTGRVSNIQERMSRLEKLHCVYVLVTLLDVYLKLPLSTLSDATLTAVKYFTTNNLETRQTFDFLVPVSCLTSFLDKSQPRFWKTTFENVNDDSEQIVMSFLSALPIDHVPVGTTTDSEEPRYYTVKVQQHSLSL
ncbi:protein zwilch homolog [Argonauta hians]